MSLDPPESQKAVRLFEGEFDTEDQLLSKIGAQTQFLKAVKKHAPEVIDSLRAGPFQCFRDAELHKDHWRTMGRYWLDLFALGNGKTLEDAIQENYDFLKSRRYPTSLDEKTAQVLTARLTPLVASLWNWSKNSGLDSDWCRARAFFTLVAWAENSKTELMADWSYGRAELELPDFQCEDFNFAWAWHPAYTSRSKIDRIVRQRFDNEWRAYLDDTARNFKGEHLTGRVKTKREPEHFTWLVWYQVRKPPMSPEEICDALGIKRDPQSYLSDDTKKVRKAINEIAHFLGLPLRPAKTSR